MFAEGQVGKVYAAVVHGSVRERSFEVDAPIGKVLEPLADRPRGRLESDLAEDLPRYVPRRRVDFEHGKPAVTRFEVERHLGGCTLLRAMPLSGRTNQIRVHLDFIGHPIVGDKVYKPRPSDSGSTDHGAKRVEDDASRVPPDKRRHMIDRQALHCRELRFAHPKTGRLLHLVAPYPADFTHLIETLALPV